MRKVSILILMIVALLAGTVFAEGEAKTEAKAEKKAHEYVGVKKCKTCHKPQFTAWSETAHAKAFDVLSAEEQKKPECTGCHTTGALATGEVIPNVECEACHGGGGDYKSAKIMSKKKWAADPDAHKKMSIDAGLVYPVEADCVRCHTKEGNANFKPFDFAKAKELVHPVPATE